MGDEKKDELMERAWNQLSGNLVWPMLTRSNYQEWSAHVQCNLEAMYLWDAVESDKIERRRDRLALGAMIRGVPAELHSLLLNKKTAKEARAAIKSMRMGAERVKEVNAQKLLAEFESISFKQGETIEDFAVRIGKLATDLRGLGEKSVDDARVVKKFLRVVPQRYNQVAVAIEMFFDLKNMSVDELVGHLRAAEERFEATVEDVTNKAGQLLMTEEDWAAKHKARMMSDPSSSSKTGGNFKKNKTGGRGNSGGGRDSRDPGGTSSGAPRRKGRCNKCKQYGHWARECKQKVTKEGTGDAGHHVNTDADAQPALLVARVCNLVRSTDVDSQKVFLNQEQVNPSDYETGSWVLDTRATNYMTGCRAALASLDETVRGAVRFGDGSKVEICGIGAVTIAGRDQSHRVLSEVYYIPSLKCNIISLGQLEEGGCRVRSSMVS